MNKKVILRMLGSLSFGVAALMFVIGSNNDHLTELKDFFWMPIPLGIIFNFAAYKTK